MMIELKCPACGAGLNLDETREIAFCEYCGQKIMLAEKRTVNVEGAVAVEGIASIDNILIRARQFYNQGHIDKADEYYNRVLDLDPFNQEAKEGVELCEAERRAMSPHGNQVVTPAQRQAAREAISQAGGNVRIQRPQKLSQYDGLITVKVIDASTKKALGKIGPKKSLTLQLSNGPHSLFVRYPAFKLPIEILVENDTTAYECQIIWDALRSKGQVEITSRDLALYP